MKSDELKKDPELLAKIEAANRLQIQQMREKWRREDEEASARKGVSKSSRTKDKKPPQQGPSDKKVHG